MKDFVGVPLLGAAGLDVGFRREGVRGAESKHKHQELGENMRRARRSKLGLFKEV